MEDFEQAWLAYARRVVETPAAHLESCEAAGGGRWLSTQGGRPLRWPGHLGTSYRPDRGILCITLSGSEHPPGVLPDEIVGNDAAEHRVLSEWADGRLNNEEFLVRNRALLEEGIPRWARWRNHYRYIIEELLGQDISTVAWANLAKCPMALNGPMNPVRLAALCQGQHPVTQLVAAVRPRAVLAATLNAEEGGAVVETWRSGDTDPLVFTWHARRGTNSDGKKLGDWAPAAAAMIRSAFE